MSLLFTIKSRTGASAEALFLPSATAVGQYQSAKVRTLVEMTKKIKQKNGPFLQDCNNATC